MTLKRTETTELYGLKNDARKTLRVRPEWQRFKKDQGAKWATLNNYKRVKGMSCPMGVFIDLENWRSKKLVLSIDTQNTSEHNQNEIHKTQFFDFNEFDYALKTMEEEFLKINSRIFPTKKIRGVNE
jgi:hypothetical protein